MLLSAAHTQITLKNPWAKVIDTITAKNTGSDLTDFVVCYPEHLASRISLIKVSAGNSTPACNCTQRSGPAMAQSQPASSCSGLTIPPGPCLRS